MLSAEVFICFLRFYSFLAGFLEVNVDWITGILKICALSICVAKFFDFYDQEI